ncbi:MAG: hypothetical protein ACRDOP_05560 [Gaiellaceae bacterium]
MRCMLGMHKWLKRQNEDSQYLLCARCGRDRATDPAGPLGRGLGGLS